MNNPLISCIMPAYNAEKYIQVAIDSILDQTITDFELIIINDGSTDRTEEIIKSFRDSRIVYVKNEHNLKLIKTLNKGIDLARGKYISRMDSDDQALPNMFERELEGFREFSDAGIINTLTYHMNEQGGGIRPNRQYFQVSPEVCSIVCIYSNMISHPGVMVKAELMKKYKYNDSEAYLHFEDKELWCRMFMDGIKCYTLNERLLNYRESPTSINAQFAKERYKRMQVFFKNYVKERWGYDCEEIPEITSFSSLFKNYIVLILLWVHLQKNGFINSLLFAKILKWQSITFAGILKRLLMS